MPGAGIGRQVQLGVAKEYVRGTSPSTPSYYLAWMEGTPEEKFDTIFSNESYGVIADTNQGFRVKNWMEANLSLPLMDTSIGLFLLSLMGTQSSTPHSGESVVFDTTFSLLNNVQHQSLSLYVHDPAVAQDYVHSNCVVNKFSLDAQVKQFMKVTIGLKGLKGTQISTLSPAEAQENRFLPQYMIFKVASTVGGLSGATAIALKSLKLDCDTNLFDDDVMGNTSPKDFLNQEFKVEGSLEAIFQNESDFKTDALANNLKAMLIDIKNTDVTIGSAAHPEVAITLDQIYYTEIGLPRKLKDIIYQTVKFRATYSVANAEMMKIVLTNLQNGY